MRIVNQSTYQGSVSSLRRLQCLDFRSELPLEAPDRTPRQRRTGIRCRSAVHQSSADCIVDVDVGQTRSSRLATPLAQVAALRRADDWKCSVCAGLQIHRDPVQDGRAREIQYIRQMNCSMMEERKDARRMREAEHAKGAEIWRWANQHGGWNAPLTFKVKSRITQSPQP